MTRSRRPAALTTVADARSGILTAALTAVALALAGCSGLPTAGPVNPGLPADAEAGNPDFAFQPDSPQPGATPEEIVDGFIRAGHRPRRGRQLDRREGVPRAGHRVGSEGGRHDRPSGGPGVHRARGGGGRPDADPRRERRRHRLVRGGRGAVDDRPVPAGAAGGRRVAHHGGARRAHPRHLAVLDGLPAGVADVLRPDGAVPRARRPVVPRDQRRDLRRRGARRRARRAVARGIRRHRASRSRSRCDPRSPSTTASPRSSSAARRSSSAPTRSRACRRS